MKKVQFDLLRHISALVVVIPLMGCEFKLDIPVESEFKTANNSDFPLAGSSNPSRSPNPTVAPTSIATPVPTGPATPTPAPSPTPVPTKSATPAPTASPTPIPTPSPGKNQSPTIKTAATAAASTVTGSSIALSVLGDDDAGESALKYSWSTAGTPPSQVSFSDNGTNAAKKVTVTFSGAGIYSFQVKIQDSGGLTVNSNVSVAVNATPTSVTVAPASSTLSSGGSQLFSATVKDQFGAALSTQPSVTWSTNGGGIVSSNGLFTAGNGSGGPFTITAVQAGSIAGTATVTISGPVDASGFPSLPTLANISPQIHGTTAQVTFNRVEGAKDYRVYVLPAPGQAKFDSAGTMTLSGATYRCSGNLQQQKLPTNWVSVVGETAPDGLGYARAAGSSVLGYVYSTPAPDRVPIYALGDPASTSDNTCDPYHFTGSRFQVYTQSPSNYTALRKKGFRDDGPLFYIPASMSGSGTLAMYSMVTGDWRPNQFRYIVTEGKELNDLTAKGATSALLDFKILATQLPGTEPLMRYHVANICGFEHDTLTVGRLNYAAETVRGDQPIPTVMWAGVTQPTTLVVEALDQTCPDQGHLTPVPVSSSAWLTLEQQRANSSTSEVYVNGQGSATHRPKAIARSFVSVSPQSLGTWDWMVDFGTLGTAAPLFTDTTNKVCGSVIPNLFGGIYPGISCYQSFFGQSSQFQLEQISMESTLHAAGVLLGELRTTFVDYANDTNGKFRVTVPQKATMSSTSYLHVTMEADTLTTARRYPQMFISSADFPMSYTMGAGSSILVQTRMEWPYILEVQLCSHHRWDVNNQCPGWTTEKILNSSGGFTWAPVPPIGETSGIDRRSKFDVYASSKRVYVFFEDKPYACVILPTATDLILSQDDSSNGPGTGTKSDGSGLPQEVLKNYIPLSGPVTVTFAETLYHSGAPDSIPEGSYGQNQLKSVTQRHFGNLGFSSGVPAPDWDEAALPCAPASQIHSNN